MPEIKPFLRTPIEKQKDSAQMKEIAQALRNSPNPKSREVATEIERRAQKLSVEARTENKQEQTRYFK